MSLPVQFRRVALGAFDAAIDWYHQNARSGVADQFETAVDEAVRAAAQTPDRLPVADGDIREVVVDGFPYCVYYRMRSGQLIVVGVCHQARDPSGWKGR
jgi:plasmid stabilization system protein ParE